MSTTPDTALDVIAEALHRAEREQRPIEPIAQTVPSLGVSDAYRIQRLGRALREREHGPLVGHKVGLTSEAMQTMLSVDQPDFGYLLRGMLHDSGSTLAAGAFIAPRVEAEIAFLLAHELSGPDVGIQDVLDATSAVAPAMEIIDSRVVDWRITIVDTVADNASCGCAVIGTWLPFGDLDLAPDMITGELQVGCESVAGTGAATLGHPAEPIAWLARTLHEFGEGLGAGEIVLPGALARALPVAAGDRAVARFSGLGHVEATFA